MTEHARDGTEVIPSVFISYRHTDADMVARIVHQLREDLGSDSVFRDVDDLIGGAPWRQVLQQQISAAHSVLLLIGSGWEAPDENGIRRIDDPNDMVRWEVRMSLESSGTSTAIPVLIDREIPGPLPDDIRDLQNRQAIRIDSATLDSADESAYPRVLAATWNSLAAHVPDGIIVVAERGAELRLKEFVRSLQAASLIDAKFLSQFGANTCLISPRRARLKAKNWPSAIVLVDDDGPSAYLTGVVRALEEHPGFTQVTIVGAAAAALAWTGASGTVASLTQSQFLDSVPDAPQGVAASTVSTAMSTSAKAAAFVAAVALVAAAAVAALLLTNNESDRTATPGTPTTSLSTDTQPGDVTSTDVAPSDATTSLPMPDAVPIEFLDAISLSPERESEESPEYPHGEPPDIQVELGPAMTTSETGDLPDDAAGEFVAREVTVRIDDESMPMGAVILPTTLSRSFLGEQVAQIRIGGVASSVERVIVDLPVREFCTERGNPSNVLGGWEFTGGDAELTVHFIIEVDDGEVVEAGARAEAIGLASRRFFDENFFEHDCDERLTLVSQWASE